MHFFSCLAQIDELELPNVHKCLPCEVELLGQQCLDTKLTPVTDRHTEAGQLVGHVVVFLSEETVEGRRLRHVNRIHRLVRNAEDLGAFEADHKAR